MYTRVWGLCVVFALGAGCGDDDGRQHNNDNQNNASPVCGNGALEAGEQCDQGAANSDTAPDACRTDCRLAYCGDQVIDASELCDGQDLGAESCESIGEGFTGGALRCASDCTFDTDSCSVCGDGIRDVGEACDGQDLGGASCPSETNHQHGVVVCAADCTLDVTGCFTCGDGQITSGLEACDGSELGGETCEGLGYTAGQLRCNAVDCTLVKDDCWSACGNGVAEVGEQCDKEDFKGLDCTAMGGQYVGGTLRCTSSCLINTADCSTCGNGVRESNEECDGADFGSLDCSSFTGQTAPGSLSCTNECRIDAASCQSSATCGNGLIDSGEQCDGPNLDQETCELVWPDLYSGGQLLCGDACFFDTTFCTRRSACGDGVIDAAIGEQCEGSDLGGAGCISLGYGGGQLACGSDCSFDVSSCVASTTCGNGSVDPAEECDGAQLGGLDCVSLGFYSGTLSCTEGCMVDTSACTNCGDGVRNAGEHCEGTDLGGETCISLGYHGGDLACTTGCEFDLSDCEDLGRCGDGVANGNEECDDEDLGGVICTDLGMGFTGGTLNCRPDCTFDTWACSNCGNGVRDVGEQCDGTDIGGLNCQDVGYASGTLGCTSSCFLSPTSCVGGATCGDGILDTFSEECDGAALGGWTCQDSGFHDGLPGCTDYCALDFAPCQTIGACDDGVWQPTYEVCDPSDTGPAVCIFLGYDSGQVVCSADCGEVLDESGCAYCGDQTLGTYEDCEGTDLGGETCEGLGFSGGTLSCTGNCEFDTSNCSVCGNTVVEPGETCDDGNEIDWDGCNDCSVTEFLVNNVTVGDQTRPDVSMLADGSFVIVWSSDGEDGDGYGVFARQYDAFGLPVDIAFPVNTTWADDQRYASVGVGPSGAFVVVWASNNQDGDGWGVYAQRFDSSGTPIGGEIPVNSVTTDNQTSPVVLVNDDGSFAVAYMSNDQDGSGWGIYLRRFDSSGQPLTTEVRVNSTTSGDQKGPTLVGNGDGSLVVGWVSAYRINYQFFDSLGQFVGIEKLYISSSHQASFIGSDMNSNGEFVFSWSNYGGGTAHPSVQRFDSSGQPVGQRIEVSAMNIDSGSTVDVALTTDGRFVVTYGEGYIQSHVWMRPYSATAVPYSDEQRINQYTAYAMRLYPRVSRDPTTGRFVVVWRSTVQDGSNGGIYAQKYSPTGSPIGLQPW